MRVAILGLVALIGSGCRRPEPPRISWTEPSSRIAIVPAPAVPRFEIRDVEALPTGGALAAGSIDREGTLVHIDGEGVVKEQRLGELLLDLAVENERTGLAIGWSEGHPTLWRLSTGGEVLETHPLPRSGVGAEPYRVLPTGIVVGTHNPVTSGVLDGWIVRPDGRGWTERIRAGGGYSGFFDAAATDDGFVAVGMGSRAASYQGWVVLERDGATTERHLDQGYSILHAVAPLPDGGWLVAGEGRAHRLDAALQTVDTLQWSDPAFFEYAQVVVNGDDAWLLGRRGTLRFQFTETVVYRIPVRPGFGPLTTVRTDPATTGGALVRLSDGSLRCLLSTETGELVLHRL